MSMLTVVFTDGAQDDFEGDSVEYDFHGEMFRVRTMEHDTFVWFYCPISTIEYIKADFAEGISYA